jgi:predicted MFS family arabinose efflux permease
MTCGVAVGNVYFPQAITPLIASGLDVPPDTAALVVTAVQLGYAVGIVLLVPLGDRLPHRPLIVTLLTIAGLSLLAAAAMPGLPPLVGVSVLVGVSTVVAPILGPMAAGLADDDRRGAVTGALLSGSIGGMLLSRAFSGSLGEWLGWQAPYLLSAGLTLVLAVALRFSLPVTEPATRQRYPALVTESLRLLWTEPELRRSCFYQACVFGGFTAVWAAVAFLITGPTYGLGAEVVGALAFVNAATMLVTPVAGRLADRHGPDPVNLVCLLGAVVSAGVLLPGALGGTLGMVTLVAGTLLLDVAMQSSMVANQVRIYALRPDVLSRLNTAYMMCGYAGGTVGSLLGTWAYASFAWPGVCALVALLAGLALARHLLRERTPTARSDDQHRTDGVL